MRKLKECFRDESGVSFPLVIAVTLSLLLILCGVMEYLRLNLMAAGVKEAVQDAIVVVVNDNLGHYRGEVEVILKDIPNDGERNLVGKIPKEEFLILDRMEENPDHFWDFIIR